MDTNLKGLIRTDQDYRAQSSIDMCYFVMNILQSSIFWYLTQ
jgi:hypothetical protein